MEEMKLIVTEEVTTTSKRYMVNLGDLGSVEMVDTMMMHPLDKMDRAARVSTDRDMIPRSEEEKKKLAHYMSSHTPPHHSPYRHSPITLLVEAPKYVVFQWAKHNVGISYTSSEEYKDLPWNEVSGRYVVMKEIYQPPHFHMQAKSKKQGASFEVHPDSPVFVEEYEKVITQVLDLYKKMVDAGVAREEARIVLPFAIKTRFYMTASMQALAHFVNLRYHPDAQSDIQKFAHAVNMICSEYFGFIWNNFVTQSDNYQKEK